MNQAKRLLALKTYKQSGLIGCQQLRGGEASGGHEKELSWPTHIAEEHIELSMPICSITKKAGSHA